MPDALPVSPIASRSGAEIGASFGRIGLAERLQCRQLVPRLLHGEWRLSHAASLKPAWPQPAPFPAFRECHPLRSDAKTVTSRRVGGGWLGPLGQPRAF